MRVQHKKCSILTDLVLKEVNQTVFVPKLACNLFSVRAAVADNNIVKFNDSENSIRGRNGNLLGTGGKLYCEITMRQGKVSIASGFVAKNKANLWHQRLGHL